MSSWTKPRKIQLKEVSVVFNQLFYFEEFLSGLIIIALMLNRSFTLGKHTHHSREKP
jgi:hypothetical protein